MSATQPVTELIVRGDGALAVLDKFENKMEAAGVATDVATGAVADFERRMETARKAIERGNAITTQSIERKTAEQRAWDRWSATVDRASALRIRLEREAQQAAVAAANAVNLGYTSQEKALGTLIALEQRHAAQLRAVADSNQLATTSATTTAAANDNLAFSMNRLAAANDNAVGSTANVAAQFQDVAVTAAMGMNPVMIALQQGTQLSAVLMTMQNPLKGLAMAFVSIINPVSLLTIGFVALTAAAIQYFTAANDNAGKANEALKKHTEWLDATIAGYERASDAVATYRQETAQLPAEEVNLNLRRKQVDLEKQYADALAVVQRQLLAETIGEQTRTSLLLEGGEAALKQRDALLDIQAAAQVSKPDLDGLALSLKTFIDSNPSSVLRPIAQDMLVGVENARALAQQVGEVDAALRNMPKDVQIRMTMSREFGSAIEGMDALYIDPRSRFDVAREQLKVQADHATAMAQTYSELVGVGEKYATVLDSINTAEAVAAEKAANSSGKSDAEKMIGNYADLVRGSQEYVTSKQIEAETLSVTADIASRMRNEQELLNKAANDNIALSPAQREEIAALAQSMADADMVLAGAQMRMENRSPWQTMAAEIANLDAMVRAGAISWEEYHAAATQSMAGAASDTLGSIGQITGALSAAFENNKALAVANAVINTAEGVTKALAQGGMFAFPIAAAIGVAGAAQIAAIMSASPGGSGGAVRTPSASVPTMTNAPQRQAEERAPDRLEVTLMGLDRNSLYDGNAVESLIRMIEERSADGRVLKIKVA